MDPYHETFFQTLFNQLPEPRVVVKADSPRFTIVAFNKYYEAISNTADLDIIGKGIAEIHNPNNENTSGDIIIKNALSRTIESRQLVKLDAVRYDIPNASGKMKQSWWQAEYTPVVSKNGIVEYIMCTTHNITEQMFHQEESEKVRKQEEALEREQNLNEELAATNEELTVINDELLQSQQNFARLNNELEERVDARTSELFSARAEAENQRDSLNRFFMQAPAGICVCGGVDLVFELVNPSYQQLFPNRNLLGKPLLEALPEIKGQPIWDIIQNVYNTGITFEGNELLISLARNDGSPVEDRYFNFIYQARLDQHKKVDGILVFVFEVTETVKVKHQVAESEKRFRFLLNAIPQQVWTAKPDGALDYVNQIVCDDFENGVDEIVGHGWQAFIHPDDLPGALQTWIAALETGNEYVVEFRLLMHGVQYKWHLARAVPLVEDGEIKLWLGTNTNIDFQKNNEQKKDEFLSIASHELKTPLTSIKAFNQLMKRTKDTEKLNNLIHKSAEHIYRLEKLISDLLDVTKINAGKINYSMQDFNFKQMLEESIESVQHTSPSHQIILKTVEEINYQGDRFRMEQVMNNFLTNAIKYSPEGKSVIVNCKVEFGNIIVSVQDFGIGIAKENLDRLFERYYREDNTAMRFEGLGLGLFISSEILKRHKGSFWIESEQGKGSTFYFRLPLFQNDEDKSVIKTDVFYKDDSITIIYNHTNFRLDVNWTGFQNIESVQRGCINMLEMLNKNKCYKIINDNRQVLGTWSEASEWVGGTFFPMMEKVGVKYLAWVFSPSVFSQLSAKKTVDISVGDIITQFFTDISLAEEWVDGRKV